jgi:high-affinity nickel-transport protein
VSLRGTSSSCLLGPFGLTLLEVGTYLHDQMLFTAGMTLLDSIDSILMLYSYTGFAEHRFHLFEPVLENDARDHKSSVYREAAATSVTPAQLPRSEGSHENETEICPLSAALSEQSEQNRSSQGNIEQPAEVQLEDKDAKIRDIRKEAQRELRVKRNMMSGLSILLTLMSIVVAFRYEFPPQPTSNPTDTRLSVYH